MRACVAAHSLGAEAHAQAGQVPVGEGEDDHEDDVPGVVGKDDGEGMPRLNVAQHEEGDEDEPRRHQGRKPHAVFTWLQGKTTIIKTGANQGLQFVQLLPWRCLHQRSDTN